MIAMIVVHQFNNHAYRERREVRGGEAPAVVALLRLSPALLSPPRV